MLVVTEIESATDKNMQALAELSVQSDDTSHPTRLAIIARSDLHYGLARMYVTYRSMQPKSIREISVFRSRKMPCDDFPGTKPLPTRQRKGVRFFPDALLLSSVA